MDKVGAHHAPGQGLVLHGGTVGAIDNGVVLGAPAGRLAMEDRGL